ncbi:MAG: hypothetical protein AAGH88_05365 [Planctomycetota bacterium]
MKRITVRAMLTLGGLGLGIGVGPATAEDAEPRAEAPAGHVYEHFMRPPGPGKGYDTWADASGPDIGEVDVDPARLPSRVDNSIRPEFPPIYRQRYGTCGQFTAAASMFTYEMNVAQGTTADSEARRFPATFSWNMMNHARNRGSEAYHGWEVAKHLGLPTVQTYGTVEHKTIGYWPNGYAVWRDAMNYRVTGYRYTPAQTVDQLNEARGWLYDRNQPEADEEVIGGVLAMDGRMGEMEKVTVTIPEGAYAAGQDIWTRWGPTGHGHGMTCVGYDDQVGYDLNGDGQITNDIDLNGDGEVTLADWERGAYIIVNSWGRKWSGDGRIYLLYSAMIDPTWKRGNYLGRVEVARHHPRMTLKLTVSCSNRSDLRLTVGLAGDRQAIEAEQTYAPEAFNGWPVFRRGGSAGDVPMAGPDDDTPLEIGIDLTPLLDALGHDAYGGGKVFLRLSRQDGSDATGELHAASVRLYDREGELATELPIDVTNGTFSEEPFEISKQVPDIKP